jgi:hypothetical protein
MSTSKKAKPAADTTISAIPTGVLTLETFDSSKPPNTCPFDLYSTVLEYNSDGAIPRACNIVRPVSIRLSGAPSALTLRFVGGSCWDSDPAPKKFRIELKTTQALTNTEDLLINDVLRGAVAAHDDPGRGDGIVVPGLRALSVYRAEETGPAYDYVNNMSCIHIYRSGD